MKESKTYGSLSRGLPAKIPVVVKDVNYIPMDLTGAQVYFTIKDKQYDFDREDTFAKVKKFMTLTNAADGSFIIELSGQDLDLPPGEYYFDIVLDGWRIVNLPFTLVGGPTNRSAFPEVGPHWGGETVRPLQVIARQDQPVIVITQGQYSYEARIKELERKVGELIGE